MLAGTVHSKLLQPPLQVRLAQFRYIAMFPQKRNLLQHPLQELSNVEHKRTQTMSCWSVVVSTGVGLTRGKTSKKFKEAYFGSGRKTHHNFTTLILQWNVMISVHQRGKNLVGQASQPLVVHLRAFLLRLPLLQEPVTVLIDGLHDIAKNH